MSLAPLADTIAQCYDSVAPTYDQSENAALAQKLIWQTYEHLTWKPVEALLPPDRSLRILDAGGGGGKFSARFAALGHAVTVLDLSPGMVELARQKLEAEGLATLASFVVGNVLALPFPDASFDLVFCEGDPVSYCLEQYPRAMAELVRVARPGAPVILGVDSRYDHLVLGALQAEDKTGALALMNSGRSTCPYGLPVHTFTFEELHAGMHQAGAVVDEIFGKPVLFWETVQALNAAHGPEYRVSLHLEELLALQEKLSRSLGMLGSHYQVMAHRRP
ncbi:MAG: class I SAM-dependent methyltransferase [Myxococcota bacterium]